MKTIAIDTRPLLEEKWGGVSWYTFYLVKGLTERAKQGNLRLVLFYNQKRRLSAGHLFKLIKKWRCYNNVTIKGYRIPNKILNLSMKCFNFPYLDDLTRADYFIAPNLNFLALSSKIKLITICHDLSWEIFPEFYTLFQRLWHKLINPREFYQGSHKIIAVSQNTKQDLIDLYKIDADKISVVYPGIDTNLFKKINNLPKKHILFVGTLEPRKNIETLIEAYDILNNPPPLVIVGKEGWKFDKIYRFWLNSKSYHKNKIKFIQNAKQADLPKLYNQAHFFVYPSFYEGFGFPPLEAMACATPVIVGHGSSLPEIVGDAGLRADPFNVADLAQKMEKLLRDKELCDKLTKQGLEQVKKFTWEKTLELTLACMEQNMEESGGT